MAKNNDKTNVMRILDQKKIEYNAYTYGTGEAMSGTEVAKELGIDEARVFKTLVTVGKSKDHYVFVVPVAKELDLKKAANVASEKSIEMISLKELLPLTGYVHGGCSPIGMKKPFKTFVDITARSFERIVFSAGKIGYQVELSPMDLEKLISCKFEDIAI